MSLKVLLLGPVEEAVRRRIESLDRGVEILEPTLSEATLAELRSFGAPAIVFPHEVGSPASLREHVTAKLEREFSRALRHRHPLSLVLLSVDGAEAIASAHGEDALEELVAALASTFRRTVRGVDSLLGAGRGTLAVLLPDTPVAGARVVAERLRLQASRLLHKPRGGVPLKVTASAGIADGPTETVRTARDLFRSAEQALVRARSLGGDRTEPAA